MSRKEKPSDAGQQSDCGRYSTTPPAAPPDFEQAARFLTLLDESAERWTFQTFDDNKTRKDPALARVLHGTLEERWQALCDLSSRGAGVFITVNETNGKGRKAADIIRVRSVFQECDRPSTQEPPLQPHIVVESSPGKYHRYFLVDGGHRFDLFEQVMARLVQDFGSDPNAKDRARVLRLPGLHHQKDPAKPWMVRVIHESGERSYPWDRITATIRPLERPKKASKAPAGTALDDPAKVRSALATLDPDMEYSGWLAIGMALHHATAGGAEGLALWDEWSAGGRSYRPDETAYKWRTFGSGNGQPVTLANIFKLASAAGWKDAPRGNGYDQAPPADYSDYPEAQGARDRPAGVTRQSPGDKPQNGTPIKRIGDLLKEGYTYDWLIKYWIECLQTIVIFGDSRACKTLLAIDLACCIALGIDWLGCRVKQGAVVFVVGEGAGTGIRRRFRAWEIANGYSLAYAPIHIVEQHTTLPLDAARLIADIRATIEQDGGAVEIIFLDTLSRTITGSERESKDFSAYQRALDDIRAEFRCAAAFLHHVGHADKSRERGASEIGSNADVRLKMETLPAETRQLNALKLKDGAMPDPLFFKLSVVELGELDEDGDPITSVVLRQIQGYQLEQQQRPLSKNSKLLLVVLTNLLTTDMHPDGVTISTTLRAAFYETLRRNKPGLEADSLRTIFSRALSALWEAGKIAYTGIDNIRVRLAEPEETDA